MLNYSVEYNNSDSSQLIISFAIYGRDSLLTARLNIIPLPDSLGYNINNPDGKTVLPHDDRYLMMLWEYTNDGDNQIINFYDCNYNYLASRKIFEDSTEIQTVSFNIPDSILTEYSSQLFTHIELNPNYGSNPNNYLICDEDGNNNISYGECMRCFNNACQANPSCNGMCNVFGYYYWVTSCALSMGLACAYISIAY
jgi:hypothetical protein